MSRRERIHVALAVAGLFALHLLLTSGPAWAKIYADEAGYIANARYLTGGPAVNMDGANLYNPGFSILVAPLVRLLDGSPVGAYRAIVVLNGLIGSLTFAPFYLLGRRLVGLEHIRALLAAGAAALYPSMVVNASFATPELLFTFVFALTCVLAGRALDRGGTGRAVLFAFLASFLYVVHPKGLALLPVAVLFLAGLWRARVLAARPFAIATVALAAVHVAGRALALVLRDALYFGTFERITTEGVALSRLATPAAWRSAVLQAVGQSWYLLVTSLGLVGVGAWFALGRARGASAPSRL
jgi:hypothetical protein